MNQGKPLGMSEKEWNEIVQSNFNSYQQEERSRKEKLCQQREVLKAELQRQVNAKNETNREKREKDRIETQAQLDEIERKLVSDELERRTR